MGCCSQYPFESTCPRVSETRYGVTRSETRFDLFLSYAREDYERAKSLYDVLTSRGGYEVWWDRREITSGEDLVRRLEHGLARSSAGLILLSRSYLNKYWTLAERSALITQAIKYEKRLITVLHGIAIEEYEESHPLGATAVMLKSDDPSLFERIAESAPITSPRMPLPLSPRVQSWPEPPQGFVGRTSELKRLLDLLSGSGERATVAVTGPPGVGKRTLAARYVAETHDRWNDIRWIDARERADEDRLEARLAGGRGDGTRGLVVLVEPSAAILEAAVGGPRDLLLVGRDHGLLRAAAREHLSLGPLLPAEARAFLRASAGSSTELSLLDSLTRSVRCHPGALGVVASALRRTGSSKAVAVELARDPLSFLDADGELQRSLDAAIGTQPQALYVARALAAAGGELVPFDVLDHLSGGDTTSKTDEALGLLDASGLVTRSFVDGLEGVYAAMAPIAAVLVHERTSAAYRADTLVRAYGAFEAWLERLNGREKELRHRAVDSVHPALDALMSAYDPEEAKELGVAGIEGMNRMFVAGMLSHLVEELWKVDIERATPTRRELTQLDARLELLRLLARPGFLPATHATARILSLRRKALLLANLGHGEPARRLAQSLLATLQRDIGTGFFGEKEDGLASSSFQDLAETHLRLDQPERALLVAQLATEHERGEHRVDGLLVRAKALHLLAHEAEDQDDSELAAARHTEAEALAREAVELSRGSDFDGKKMAVNRHELAGVIGCRLPAEAAGLEREVYQHFRNENGPGSHESVRALIRLSMYEKHVGTSARAMSLTSQTYDWVVDELVGLRERDPRPGDMFTLLALRGLERARRGRVRKAATDATEAARLGPVEDASKWDDQAVFGLLGLWTEDELAGQPGSVLRAWIERHYAGPTSGWTAMRRQLHTICQIEGIELPPEHAAETVRALAAREDRLAELRREPSLETVSVLVECGDLHAALGSSDQSTARFDEAMSLARELLEDATGPDREPLRRVLAMRVGSEGPSGSSEPDPSPERAPPVTEWTRDDDRRLELDLKLLSLPLRSAEAKALPRALRRAKTAREAGWHEEALDALDQALAAYESLPAAERAQRGDEWVSLSADIARTLYQCAHIHAGVGGYERAIEIAREGERRAGDHAEQGFMGDLLSDMGVWMERSDRFEEAEAVTRRALEHYRAADRDDVAGHIRRCEANLEVIARRAREPDGASALPSPGTTEEAPLSEEDALRFGSLRVLVEPFTLAVTERVWDVDAAEARSRVEHGVELGLLDLMPGDWVAFRPKLVTHVLEPDLRAQRELHERVLGVSGASTGTWRERAAGDGYLRRALPAHLRAVGRDEVAEALVFDAGELRSAVAEVGVAAVSATVARCAMDGEEDFRALAEAIGATVAPAIESPPLFAYQVAARLRGDRSDSARLAALASQLDEPLKALGLQARSERPGVIDGLVSQVPLGVGLLFHLAANELAYAFAAGVDAIVVLRRDLASSRTWDLPGGPVVWLDSGHLACRSRDEIVVLDPSSGKKWHQETPGSGFFALAALTGGRFLLADHRRGVAYPLDHRLRREPRIEVGPFSALATIRGTDDIVAVQGGVARRIRDGSTQAELELETRDDGRIEVLSAPDENTLYGAIGRFAYRWSMSSGRIQNRWMAHGQHVDAVEFDIDQERVITAAGTVAREWDAARLPHDPGEPELIHLANLDDDRFVMAQGDALMVCAAADGQVQRRFSLGGPIVRVAGLSDGCVVVLLEGGSARVIRVLDWEELARTSLGRATCLAELAPGTVVAHPPGGPLVTWSWRSGEETRWTPDPSWMGVCTTALAAGKRGFVLLGLNEGTMSAIDPRTRQFQYSWRGHENEILIMCPAWRGLLTCAVDGYVRHWHEEKSYRTLAAFDRGPTSMAVAGTTVAVANGTGRLHLFDLVDTEGLVLSEAGSEMLQL